MEYLSRKLSPKKYFIWDFDGCLCDSERFHFLAYASAFAHFGHKIHEAEYYPSFTHLGDGTKREIQKHGLTCEPSQINALKAAHYWELISNQNVRLFPEVPQILQLLRNQGKKVAIASNSPLKELRVILEKNGFLDAFDLIVGKTETLRKKPFPDLFLHAMSQLGAQPDETLIFEDTDRGLEAAAAAGCEAIWVRTSFNESLTTTQPHLAALSHASLLEVVRSLPPASSAK